MLTSNNTQEGNFVITQWMDLIPWHHEQPTQTLTVLCAPSSDCGKKENLFVPLRKNNFSHINKSRAYIDS